MKTLYLFIGLLVIIYFSACDTIEGPYLEENNEIIDTTIQFPEIQNYDQNVFILEFTGHTCGNCPRSHETLHDLIADFDDQLVALAAHGGGFAEFDSLAEKYYYDFTSEESEELYWSLNGLTAGLGIVQALNTTQLSAPASWRTSVEDEIDNNSQIGLQIINVFDDASNQLTTHIETKFLSDFNDTLMLAVYVAEDYIINYQKDYDAVPQDIPNYEHNHVIRDAINSTWGIELVTDVVKQDSIIVKSYAYTLEEEWVAENCNVVAFIYDDNSKQVYQSILVAIVED